MSITLNCFSKILALGAIFAAVLATPATAGTRTRLVRCESGSCLLVTGHRAGPASVVTINEHDVAVQGARKWRVSLPLQTVRQWSAPFSRKIVVSVDDSHVQAALPIGLLGHVEDLAFLTVHAK